MGDNVLKKPSSISEFDLEFVEFTILYIKQKTKKNKKNNWKHVYNVKESARIAMYARNWIYDTM